jgi:hypothetical protein
MTFEWFREICPENWNFIEKWKEKRVLYMKTDVHW